MTPFETYQCKDKLICLIAYQRKDWTTFCQKVIKRPDLETHELFSSNGRRMKNIDALKVELEKELAKKTRDEWMAELLAVNLPCGGVNTLGEVLDDEQLQHRRMVATTTSSEYVLP